MNVEVLGSKERSKENERLAGGEKDKRVDEFFSRFRATDLKKRDEFPETLLILGFLKGSLLEIQLLLFESEFGDSLESFLSEGSLDPERHHIVSLCVCQIISHTKAVI